MGVMPLVKQDNMTYAIFAAIRLASIFWLFPHMDNWQYVTIILINGFCDINIMKDAILRIQSRLDSERQLDQIE